MNLKPIGSRTQNLGPGTSDPEPQQYNDEMSPI